MKFVKLTGLGNDYIYIDDQKNQIQNASQLAIQMSERHFGVGSDGIIILKRGSKTAFKMEMYNRDGSYAPICGNGLRCLAFFIRYNHLTQEPTFPIETDSGMFPIHIEVLSETKAMVQTELGIPNLSTSEVGLSGYGDQAILQTIHAGDRSFTFTAVSMSNPHCIIFLDDHDEHSLKSFPLEKYGPIIETHPSFTKRTNVEFVTIKNRSEIYQRTWERGTGETLACGTGAAASLVAGVIQNKLDRKITSHLVGGDLQVWWDESNQLIHQKGPAQVVFEGIWKS